MSAEMDIATRRLRHAEAQLYGARVGMSAAQQERIRAQGAEAQFHADIDRLRCEVADRERDVLRLARGAK